ncbi:MAG TPA: twin-arginine translocation signal domain-containing protein [Syntrophorhabdales bacterium]|nr:twin-arginine translocation signal domain-containing protein [Syntrophorhabdales bacterium]
MKKTKKKSSEGLTRRDLLKGSGVILGGLALGGAMIGGGAGKAHAHAPSCPATNGCHYPVRPDSTQEYTYPRGLGDFTPDTPLDADEMRITFLGTVFPPNRRAQQMMSIFVEVGPWIPESNGPGKATDSFVFDCGAGVLANYAAMGISFGRMDKILISHLHADHMSDLSAIYCFGPANDRKSPLYVFGQGPSGVQSPAWGNNPPKYYDDGTKDFCECLRKAMRWHSESFSFLPSNCQGYPTAAEIQASWGLKDLPESVGDDPWGDGYALVPIQLDWWKNGKGANGKPNGDNVAYYNKETGVRITHFPVIHTRKGSMGYKLEWTNPTVLGAPMLSMIYTSDTRPETNCIDEANNVDPSTGKARGVDVFIHEMILPPELLAMKNYPGMTWPDYSKPGFQNAVQNAANIEDSSHTPQGAYGYVLTQINPHPRLAVIAHFPTEDDTVKCAMNSVRAHFPHGVYPVFGRDIIWSTDLMVLRVKKSGITQLMGNVSDYTFAPPQNVPPNQKTPKYPTPTAQLDTSTLIDSGPNTYCDNGY